MLAREHGSKHPAKARCLGPLGAPRRHGTPWWLVLVICMEKFQPDIWFGGFSFKQPSRNPTFGDPMGPNFVTNVGGFLFLWICDLRLLTYYIPRCRPGEPRGTHGTLGDPWDPRWASGDPSRPRGPQGPRGTPADPRATPWVPLGSHGFSRGPLGFESIRYVGLAGHKHQQMSV